MNNQRTISKVTLRTVILAVILISAMAFCAVQASAASSGGLVQTKTNTTTTSVALKWNAQSDTSYYIVKYHYGNTDKKVTTKNTSITLKNVKKNAYVSVNLWRKLNNSTAEQYVGHVIANPIPTKVTGVKCSTFYPSINTADFQWNRKDNADGYQIKVLSTSGKKSYANEQVTSRYFSLRDKLKVNRFYKVKVRAYVKINDKKVYGKYSNYNYFSGGPKNVYLTKYDSKLKIKWDKVTGAKNYSVYVSRNKPTDSYKSMTKVKTTSKTSYSLYKLKGKKYKKSRTYYVYVVANKKVGSKTFHSVPYYYRYI